MKEMNKSNLDLLRKKKDEEIDYSDIPKTDLDFWEDAMVVYPSKKVTVSLNIDEDLAVWLQQMGKESNNAVNNLLRSYFIGVKKLSSH
jgi:uncharacterized protein (DUF4415 family)